MAQALVNSGASVTTWSRSEISPALAQLLPTNRLYHLVCDVRNELEVQDAVKHTVDRYGPLSGCITNAGVRGKAHKLTEPGPIDPNDCWQTNFMGTLYTLQAVARMIVKHNIDQGRLVAIGSLAAETGAAGWTAYASSKSALTGLVRSLAQELAPHGTTVNLVVPGLIETEMNSDILNNRAYSQAITRVRIPLRKWGKPSDLVGICMYLLSDLSSYHTGDILTIDGGYQLS